MEEDAKLFFGTKKLGKSEKFVCMNAQSLDWNDLRFVLAVCHEGTLSGAARRLGVNHSTVFRRINGVEDQLGVRLFKRLQSGYAMTEAGEAVLEAGDLIENEVLQLSHKLIGRDLRLHGTLRVAAPDALAAKVLTPHIAAFSDNYPDIQLELSISNSHMNLTRREADVAIRATRIPPEAVIGRRVCTLATTIYGSTSYLAAHVDQSPRHYSWLMPDDELAYLPATKWLHDNYPSAQTLLRSNSFLTLFEAAKQGHGVVPLPCFLGDPDPELQRVIDPMEDLASEVWLLTHPDLRRTARVRTFTDFMMDALKKKKDLLEGNQHFN